MPTPLGGSLTAPVRRPHPARPRRRLARLVLRPCSARAPPVRRRRRRRRRARSLRSRSRVDGGRSFGKEEAPALYGRNALSLGGMSPALGTQSMGSCNDDEHKFTRPHCFDVRDYGSTLGISGHSSRENLSNCKEPPAWSFSKSKRKSNVASWRGLR